MKKKIVIFIVIIFITVASIIAIIFVPPYMSKIKKEKRIELTKIRIEEIRKAVDKEMPDYFHLIHPICTDNTGGTRTSTNGLIYNRGMDRKTFLDIDGETLCKVNVFQECKNGENVWEISIGCKYYQDEGFVDCGY